MHCKKYIELIIQSWIFKSFSDAAATTDATTDATIDATTDATASAANKTGIFKSFSRNAYGNTRGSLALPNDCCQRAVWCFRDHLWKHYLIVAILWVAVVSQNDLNL